MGSLRNDKDLVVTQISVGNFDEDVTAKALLDYFEDEVGLVWRCRLKTSSTPSESYPDFTIESENVEKNTDYEKVEPHAFVHFATPNAAELALDASGRNGLIFCNKVLKISLGPENPHRLYERRRTNVPFRLSDVGLEMGLLASKNQFIVGFRGPNKGIDFLVDPFNGKCRFLFTKNVAFSLKDEAKHIAINCNFKIEFLVREINEIKEYKDYSSLVILLQLASSPLIYYRTADDDIEETVPFDVLDDDDPWIRTTDFTKNGAIGRCNTYRLSIPPRNGPNLVKALNYLRNRRVPVLDYGKQKLSVRDEPDFGILKSEPFFSIQNKEDLSFKVLFLVNAVMHKGIMNQHQFSDYFFRLLQSQSEDLNIVALKHICGYRQPVYDASKTLAHVQQKILKNPKLLEIRRELDDIVEVRRLIITPTKAYCLPPDSELSNRVLRHYKHISDRFLRVTFMDEGMQTLNQNVLSYYACPIVSRMDPQKTTLFKRVRSVLTGGFNLCGRKYSFLAFSANQLRDRSAWFFAEDENVVVADIKKWMGRFTNRNIAKCAARMGQCFSSTYATVEVSRDSVSDLPDIERNGYVFSDGIGIISPDLAKEVIERLRLSSIPPCAFQIRYAGCKGVVACWPPKDEARGAHEARLYLRPSMKKFESNHTILEICSWTRFQPGFLNRQIVTLLSSLDVEDEIFWNMQQNMMVNLNCMLEDADVAFEVLSTSCLDQGDTPSIMLSAGFKPQTEPHLRGMLKSIRAGQLEDLREKARIFVPLGRWLMGCLDELGVLEQGQCFVQISTPSLEHCFVKHGSNFSETKQNLQVIKGLVVIAKNPCLHPGDVRILEAVDIPELHHLYDCLVFPQKGDRPHANEASGSDLDGDLYFVTWDQNLIPPRKRSWPPMEYTPAEVKALPREVNHKDIIEFFTRNIVNENLGTICNSHVVHADISDYGAMDEKCLKLAELAALAVDFPKTGKLVNMPPSLKPKLYPDFMGKEEFQSYKSEKILGRLYRQIKEASENDHVPYSEDLIPNDIEYDTDLQVSGSEMFLEDAWVFKSAYDEQLNGLLGQYKVNREEEVVTGHIWSMRKNSSKKQGELKERLKKAYDTLRNEFRRVFEQLGPDFDEVSEQEKNIVYEKKASAWYQVTYDPMWVKKSLELESQDGVHQAVMLSFPWIAADYIARIKIKSRGLKNNSNSDKPINSLGKYLADKL